MTRQELLVLLQKYSACYESVEWVDSLPTSIKTARGVWNKCERGDWMLWIAAKLEIDRRILVFAACQCARISLKYVPEGEERPRIAIETAEEWTRGRATLKDVRTAADAAYAASYAVYAAVYAASYASYASYAAADAADAVPDAASYVSYAAAYAADAASYADYAADPARKVTLAECAVIVRKHIPFRLLMKSAEPEDAE